MDVCNHPDFHSVSFPVLSESMIAYLFSCEFATCAVPEAHRDLFKGAEDVVSSTAGWEPGALNLAQAFAMKFRTPLVHGEITRLLIDLEQDGEKRWSRFSKRLPEPTRGKLAERHEKPYRHLLEQRITEDLRRYDHLFHILVHTSPDQAGRITLSTPQASDHATNAASQWRDGLRKAELDVIHLSGQGGNALTKPLAAAHPAESYVQIRLDVAQSFFLDGRPLRWDEMKKILLDTLKAVTL